MTPQRNSVHNGLQCEDLTNYELNGCSCLAVDWQVVRWVVSRKQVQFFVISKSTSVRWLLTTRMSIHSL